MFDVVPEGFCTSVRRFETLMALTNKYGWGFRQLQLGMFVNKYIFTTLGDHHHQTLLPPGGGGNKVTKLLDLWSCESVLRSVVLVDFADYGWSSSSDTKNDHHHHQGGGIHTNVLKSYTIVDMHDMVRSAQLQKLSPKLRQSNINFPTVPPCFFAATRAQLAFAAATEPGPGVGGGRRDSLCATRTQDIEAFIAFFRRHSFSLSMFLPFNNNFFDDNVLENDFDEGCRRRLCPMMCVGDIPCLFGEESITFGKTWYPGIDRDVAMIIEAFRHSLEYVDLFAATVCTATISLLAQCPNLRGCSFFHKRLDGRTLLRIAHNCPQLERCLMFVSPTCAHFNNGDGKDEMLWDFELVEFYQRCRCLTDMTVPYDILRHCKWSLDSSSSYTDPVLAAVRAIMAAASTCGSNSNKSLDSLGVEYGLNCSSADPPGWDCRDIYFWTDDIIQTLHPHSVGALDFDRALPGQVSDAVLAAFFQRVTVRDSVCVREFDRITVDGVFRTLLLSPKTATISTLEVLFCEQLVIADAEIVVETFSRLRRLDCFTFSVARTNQHALFTGLVARMRAIGPNAGYVRRSHHEARTLVYDYERFAKNYVVFTVFRSRPRPYC